uniref:Regulator of telomere elongation helicase 1 n=1 Tax=Oryzias melastigma TaxID=30732 RepID=A0A3B3CSV6_ORYME
MCSLRAVQTQLDEQREKSVCLCYLHHSKFHLPPISSQLKKSPQRMNGVLESPTGTGKTLCLLCATLAWREHFRDTISVQKIAERVKGEPLFPDTPLSSWGTAATDGDKPVHYSDIPKIIYASRTHSQLAQVIGELRRTSYRPKVCVLGSRDQLCINQEVMRQESNHVKVHMCRGKVSTRSCHYYNNVEESSTDKDLTSSILDVEDLVKFGVKQKVCPYYLSRSLKQQADLIFMPYNYLLDPKSRRAHSIELGGAVVIFDEAHNLEKMCEESSSFDLTPYDVASAITAVDRLLVEQTKQTGGGEFSAEDLNVESLNSGLKLDVKALAKIKQILLDLEAAIDSYDVPSDRGVTKPGIFIYELLERAHLNYSTKTAVLEALDQIIGYLAGQPGIFFNTSGLQKLSDIIQLVFSGEPTKEDEQKQMESNSVHFKVHMHQDSSRNKRKQSTDPWTSSSSKKQGNILSYWCFSPGFSMLELQKQGVRCIILTSGTLSPLSSFTSELRIPFPVRLENGHVIERDQIFVSVVPRGPDGVLLSSAFDRRFLPENMFSLGNTVANISRVVPHGLLAFFPSFPMMEKILEFWRASGHADRIDSVKPMFVEPKGAGSFTEIIDGYYKKVSDPASKGGSFFAVCRGKASEGLDFADTFSRGVIITGLPFPPKLDPRVVLKMQFLDEMSRNKAPGVRYLLGQEWYRQQAFRAVNQAIGRVIRHKEDYGAIFLCDQRFRNSDARAHLPSWVKPHVRIYDNFGNVVRDVSQFFRVAQKLRPVVPKSAAAESGSAAWSPPTHSTPSASCSSSQSSCAQKAKALDAHLPSLKRRKLCEQSGGGGMARICLDYECEPREGQRRPASLLDALEREDGSRGDDGAAGQEKTSRVSTRSLQYDERMEDELRGGKRKIKLIQHQPPHLSVPEQSQSEDLSEEKKTTRAKRFLAGMKKSFSKVTFDRVVHALQTYKQTDELDALLSEMAVLAEDTNTHSLLRGFYQFVRPHHKLRFDERCAELTGLGCGYKPEHSLSKDQKKAIMQQSEVPPGEGQLDTRQLNGGGRHLSQGGLKEPQAAPVSFLADVKKTLGAAACSLLCEAISSYKKTDDYDHLMTTVVSLFTERDDDFQLLVRFNLFIRAHHKKKYRELLDGLIGQQTSSGGDPEPREEQPSPASPRAPKTQTKIHSFFSETQKK